MTDASGVLNLHRPVREAFKAAVQWTAIEASTRWGLGFLLLISAGWNPRTPVERSPSSALALSVSLAVALVFLAGFFRRKVRREGLDFADLGYARSQKALVRGLISGVILILLAQGTGQIDLRLFPGLADDAEKLIQIMALGGPVAAGALLVANAGLAPVVEEFVWRGYIQTKMTQAWGIWKGIAATALLFAGKHVFVDISINRTITLIVGGFALGFIRHRWGTTASTVTHLVLNLLATSLLIAQAFTRGN